MLDYMIYIITFTVGSILGLLYSYSKHGEPFVAVTDLNIPFMVVSIVGWFLGFNSGNVILSAIGFLLAGFVMGERPGYGRKDAKLELMQRRIVKSFAVQRDVIIPLSKEFDCTVEELEDVFFHLFDMSSLQTLHATFESARDICLYQKLNADLRLCWFNGTFEVISDEDAKNLKMELIEEIKNGKSYEEALKEGQLKLFELLKKEAIY